MKSVLIVIAISIPCFFLTAWAIFDSFRREFDTTGKKAIWMIVAAVPYIGFVFYFLIGVRQGRKPTGGDKI